MIDATGSAFNRRILVIDDTASVHEDIRRVLCPPDSTEALDSLTAAVLGNEQPASREEDFSYEIESAYQGEEGLELVRRSLGQGRPFAMAFVDMRMPPGWDGVETIERIWKEDPQLQVVICTAYSDCSWHDIIDRLHCGDRLLVLKKPFDGIEVCQLAYALTQKWYLERQIQVRLDQLEDVNQKLEFEVVQRRRVEDQLRHDSLHDTLTGLPNRALLRDRVERCIERTKRQDGYQFAVLFLDIDNFKVINDSLGHRAGDRLLREISGRMNSSLRTLDSVSRPIDNTAARLGGDEFVVVLDGIEGDDHVKTVAQRILHSIRQPYSIEGRQVRVTISVGVSVSQFGYDLADEVLRDADTALYQAKRRGKDRVVVFEAAMREQALLRLQVGSDLRDAIRHRQLLLHFQPIVDLCNGDIEGFEALVRWMHPQHGLMAPREFIPIAEESGLIVDVGEWVLREACYHAQLWKSRVADAGPFTMSVNISSKQLMTRSLIDQLDLLLDSATISAEALKLELTESAVMEHTEFTETILGDLRDRRLALRMDDFGTGYSSLSHLHDLPFEAIKLDRSFVSALGESPNHVATVQAVITLAHNQGKTVIAEGVETVEQLRILQDLRCDEAQGFFFARPMNADRAEALLETGGAWVEDVRSHAASPAEQPLAP